MLHKAGKNYPLYVGGIPGNNENNCINIFCFYSPVGGLATAVGESKELYLLRRIDQFRDQYEMTYICSFYMRSTPRKTVYDEWPEA